MLSCNQERESRAVALGKGGDTIQWVLFLHTRFPGLNKHERDMDPDFRIKTGPPSRNTVPRKVVSLGALERGASCAANTSSFVYVVYRPGENTATTRVVLVRVNS